MIREGIYMVLRINGHSDRIMLPDIWSFQFGYFIEEK